MHNVLFSIGPVTIHAYGLMIALGVLAAYAVARYRAQRTRIDVTQLDSLVVWVLLFGILGAKLLFWLTEIREILRDLRIILQGLSDGFVVYGGIIGGVLAGVFYCRRRKLNFLAYFDLMAPSVALAQAFGRIGCFFAGCCYGMETNSALGVVFPSGSLAPSGVSLLPTQLFSSALDFILFGVLVAFARRDKRADGQVVALYVILYSVGRFLLEFFRGDIIRGSVGALSTSQFISIFVFIFGCCMVAFTGHRNRGKRLRS